MPYVITTKARKSPDPVVHLQVISRYAVATLDEAHEAATLAVGVRRIIADPGGDHEAACPAWDEPASVALALPASGGTVGPLSDGTTIKVDYGTWDDLVGPAGWGTHTTEAAVVDAYNAAQGG